MEEIPYQEFVDKAKRLALRWATIGRELSSNPDHGEYEDVMPINMREHVGISSAMRVLSRHYTPIKEDQMKNSRIKKAFKNQEFSHWIQEGIIAKTIVNKLMSLCEGDGPKRPEYYSTKILPPEREILKIMVSKFVGKQNRKYKQRLVSFLKLTELEDSYPLISEHKIEKLLDCVDEYRTLSQFYPDLSFAKNDAEKAVIEDMLWCFWNALGPAMYPVPYWDM